MVETVIIAAVFLLVIVLAARDSNAMVPSKHFNPRVIMS